MKDIKIPDSLLPENIFDTIEKRDKIRKVRFKKRILKVGTTLATAAALITLTLISVFNGFILSDENDNVSDSDIKTIGSYESLYTNHIKDDFYRRITNIFNPGTKYGTSMDAVIGNAATEESFNESDTVEHSETNIQTEGVDESDIIKTDGKNIYIAGADGNLKILKAAGSESFLLSEFDLVGDIVNEKEGDLYNYYSYTRAMYLNDDVITVILGSSYTYGLIKNDFIYEDGATAPDSNTYDIMPFYNNTFVITISVKDPEKPVILNKLTQEGTYKDSRMKDGFLYIFTDKYIDYSTKESVYVKVNDEVVPEEKVYISENGFYTNYVIISSLDVANSKDFTNTLVYTTNSYYSQLYVSSENIYLLESMYNNEESTDILKITYKDGNMLIDKKASVKGNVNDQFSADEYNGFLRIVTTKNTGNNLYILDKDLNVTGEILDLAKEESIFSARFLGDTGYFVTFKMVDPLFSVDLSDPYAPKVLGALKIPGFSTYLHFIDENTLLGLGENADENGFMQSSMKLSLFDVSNPADVKEIQKIDFDKNSYSEALYNHKSILYSKDKNLFGFCLNNYDYMESSYIYKVFSYENNMMVEKESLSFTVKDNLVPIEIRGIYAGDFFYLVNLSETRVYNLSDILSNENATLIKEINY